MSARLIMVCFGWMFTIPAFSNTDTLRKRENLCGDDVVPVIHFPGIPQTDFKDAFKVLDECLVMDEPRFGFSHPFIAPGGHYGGCWWQLDGSISLQATKWVNQRFSENMLRGFMSVQKPDGRIPLYGHDKVPGYPTCSSLPKYFEAAYAVLKQSSDRELMQQVYGSMKKYLEWWFSDVRRDETTELITGVFEESFPPVEKEEKATAQVDLNVEIAEGCRYVAMLARELEFKEDETKYNALERSLKTAINKYLWNEQKGAFYSYRIKERSSDDRLVCYAFDPLRMNIAQRDKHARMLAMLQDNSYFNWNGNGVTSVSKTDTSYNETTGNYNGAPAWSGDIWSLRNEAIVQGLGDIGRYDLAAALSLKTVRLFNANYTEFIKPSDGSGHGVQRYAWSAAQYIQLLIENIFGIEYNRFTQTITIQPNLDVSLAGKEIAIEKLLLADGNRLSVYITNGTNVFTVKYIIEGTPRNMNVIVGRIDQANRKFTTRNADGKQMKPVILKKGNSFIHQVNNGSRYVDSISFSIK